MNLGYCPKCKENSLIKRVYKGVKRVEFCINKGCGYKQDLPLIKEEK